MNRRELLLLLGGAVAAPHTLLAQPMLSSRVCHAGCGFKPAVARGESR
jgi:hypothetical protein